MAYSEKNSTGTPQTMRGLNARGIPPAYPCADLATSRETSGKGPVTSISNKRMFFH
jgi:hypothetical protein